MRQVCFFLCLLVPLSYLGAVPPAVAEMNVYLSKAQDAADSNHLSEAIRSYVTVLALADESPSPEAKATADQATAALARIGTRLTLEPSSEWVDSNGAQIAGSSRSLGQEGGLPRRSTCSRISAPASRPWLTPLSSSNLPRTAVPSSLS